VPYVTRLMTLARLRPDAATGGHVRR
jgi:hypothetical protein